MRFSDASENNIIVMMRAISPMFYSSLALRKADAPLNRISDLSARLTAAAGLRYSWRPIGKRGIHNEKSKKRSEIDDIVTL